MARYCDLWNRWLFSTRHPSCRRRRPATPFADLAAEVLEVRALLSAPAVAPDNVRLTISGGAVTLSATDAADHTVEITRSGGNVVFTGSKGTLITFGGSQNATQSVALASVKSLSINPGNGSDNYQTDDLSVSGAVTFNGAHAGSGVLTINGLTTPVVIGGSVNFTTDKGSIVSFNGTVTVVGAFNFRQQSSGQQGGSIVEAQTEAGQAMKFEGGVNIQGNSTGSIVEFNAIDGTIAIDGGLKINMPNASNIIELDSVQGQITVGGAVTMTDGPNSIIEIFNHVTINGSLTIKGGEIVEIEDVGTVGAPIVNGATRIQLSHQADIIEIISTDAAHPVQLNGTLSITTSSSNDSVEFSDAKVTGNVKIGTGGSPAAGDKITVDGSEFDGTFSATMKGPNAVVDLATTHTNTTPTLFKQNVKLQMTGASASVEASNSNAGTPLTFLGTLLLHGGNPVGTYATFGTVSFTNPADLILVKFLIAP
jgi:hypothetical protein